MIHGLAVITAIILGTQFSSMFGNTPLWIWPEGWGFDLPVVYAYWAGIVLMLYPLCAWFADIKNRHKENKWLSYMGIQVQVHIQVQGR